MRTLWKMEGGGALSVMETGPRVLLEAVRPEDGRGLYKAWARGERGRELLLGTLLPEGGNLRLTRTLSRRSLEEAGCWPITGGRAVLAFSFTEEKENGWDREPNPERFCRDGLLRQCLTGKPGFLSRREGEDGFLAVPFHQNVPFPLTPLFCLAQMETVRGLPYLVWRFDRTGDPVVPEEGEARDGKRMC